jgi:hypothetical protein
MVMHAVYDTRTVHPLDRYDITLVDPPAGISLLD